jgi:23S rRNA (uracil1939-C5)-methyltransferase
VATFSRDLQLLLQAGLTVRELQPLDLFPHTPHVELLCWLQR